MKLSHLWAAGLICLLSGCEAIDLINSVGTILKPSASASPSPSASPGQPVASAQPTIQAAPTTSLEIVRSGDPTPVSLDWNLARLQGVELMVSSTLNPTYEKSRLLDGKLTTSWFTSEQDMPSKGKLPTIELGFSQPVGVLSINLRGDRERSQGLQIEELSVLITSAQGILLNETLKLPADAQDLNLVLRKPVDGATSLRLTVTRSRGTAAPGLAELEVLGRK
ncbi:MAG TPA: hypothetical protein V6D23_10905 [Candidatus Obscuribacterales bacterium]